MKSGKNKRVSIMLENGRHKFSKVIGIVRVKSYKNLVNRETRYLILNVYTISVIIKNLFTHGLSDQKNF
jgi:hypothetical protein